MIKVILDKCTGCTLCVKACPFGAIEIVDKKAKIDLSRCNLCAACVTECKFSTIVIERKEKERKDLSEYKNVWVFVEQKRGSIQPVAYELLGKARELADELGSQLWAILLGYNLKEKAQSLLLNTLCETFKAFPYLFHFYILGGLISKYLKGEDFYLFSFSKSCPLFRKNNNGIGLNH